MGIGNTLVDLLDDSVRKYGEDIAIRRQIPGEPRSDKGRTYRELQERAFRVSNYLLSRGVDKGDRVMLITNNLPEFVEADFGVLYAGAVSVPVDQHLRIESLYGDYSDLIEPKLIVVDPKYDSKVRKYCGKFPIVSLEDVFKGEATDPKVEVNYSDLATIIFSSGVSSVTGRDFKAVMLSHDNLYTNIEATQFLHEMIEKTDGVKQEIYLAGLEKHWHAFGYMVVKSALSVGGRAHFTSKSELEKGNAAHINPHYMIMVPKSANDILEDIKNQVSEKGSNIADVFEWFLKQSNDFHYQKRNENKYNFLKGLAHIVGDKVFYSKIRKELQKKFGRNKISFLGGSANLPLDIEMSFNSFDRTIYNGYGLSEMSPVVSMTRSKDYLFGYSGELILGVDAQIVDSDMAKNGELKLVKEGNKGLLLLKGPGVFQGYYRDSESTENAFLNGWLNTGDLAILNGKSLRIEGRVDDEFKLSNGEKISPYSIENYCSNRGLNLLVVGKDRKRVGGLIISENGLLIEDILKSAYDELSDSREKIGIDFSEGRLAVICPTEKNYTSTLKLRRNALLEEHSLLIDSLCN